jgi:selenocysteine lyase/cysteine desulfurase
VAEIEATLGAQTATIAQKARGIGLSPTPDHARGAHYLSIALPDDAPPDLMARLTAARIFVSQRGRSLRVTPHLYNDTTDADRLIAALGAAL